LLSPSSGWRTILVRCAADLIRSSDDETAPRML